MHNIIMRTTVITISLFHVAVLVFCFQPPVAGVESQWNFFLAVKKRKTKMEIY